MVFHYWIGDLIVELQSPLETVRLHNRTGGSDSDIIGNYVLFFVELATRRVHIAGIIHDPRGEWMGQIARNITDACDGLLLGKRMRRD